MIFNLIDLKLISQGGGVRLEVMKEKIYRRREEGVAIVEHASNMSDLNALFPHSTKRTIWGKWTVAASDEWKHGKAVKVP